MVNFSGTFDTTNALSGMFLWIIFGYLATLLNCDLQRFIIRNPLSVHLIGLTAFFFLFTLIDTNNKTSLWIITVKTILIYVLFVLMTKSKWYFVVPVLVLLLVDQAIKKHLAIQQASGGSTSSLEETQKRATQILNVLIISIILIGTMQYMYLQYLEYGKRFSLYKFFFGVSKCKDMPPNYKSLSIK